MRLTVLAESFAVCRLLPSQDVSVWAWRNKTLLSMTYTADELSIVCVGSAVPDDVLDTGNVGDVQYERNWRALKVQGPLDFSLTGILAALAGSLASAGIAIFALSTFDTDYILVKEDTLQQAIVVLQQNGHVIEKES